MRAIKQIIRGVVPFIMTLLFSLTIAAVFMACVVLAAKGYWFPLSAVLLVSFFALCYVFGEE